MLKIAVYGKGGIGKSTITSNLAAAFAVLGKKVIQIGCDPKADSTINLLGGKGVTPVMNFMREYDREPETIGELSKEGFGGVLCIETGGPTPGLGCAGRGIITTFSLLADLGLFEKYQPDVVLYDVLGDVVCGGFAAPIREGYASKVLIVTSGEKMALYAANNIHSAVKNFEDRGYAAVRGIVLNRRAVENEEEKVRAFAEANNLEIVADIPRSNDIIHYEDQNKTVIEGDRTLDVAISGKDSVGQRSVVDTDSYRSLMFLADVEEWDESVADLLQLGCVFLVCVFKSFLCMHTVDVVAWIDSDFLHVLSGYVSCGRIEVYVCHQRHIAS